MAIHSARLRQSRYTGFSTVEEVCHCACTALYSGGVGRFFTTRVIGRVAGGCGSVLWRPSGVVGVGHGFTLLGLPHRRLVFFVRRGEGKTLIGFDRVECRRLETRFRMLSEEEGRGGCGWGKQ